MEPRKGALGFLASAAKSASAGGILALALAATLALAGCGGDSDAEVASTLSPPPAKQSGTTDSQTSSSPASGEAAKDKAKDPAPTSQAQGASAKQGASAPLPSGAGGRERGPTPQEEAEATIADMTLRSPALIGPEAILPRAYTCDGKDSWPALQWQGAPADTEELVLLAMNSQPVEGKLFFDWALAGIDPSLGEIEAGRLPKGAISGKNSFGQSGYSICPAPGEPETYVFALFALPEALSPPKGFDPRQLRLEVLEVSGNVGLMAASYAR